MKYILLHFMVWLSILLVGCKASKSTSQSQVPELITSSISDLDSLMGSSAQPIVVFIHTDWCKYCQNMMETTLKDERLIQLLNENYHFIAFNGEHKSDVVLAGQVYSYEPNGSSGGIHELTKALGTIDGKVSYPAFIILNNEFEIIFQHASYLNVDEMFTILTTAASPK